MEHGKNFDLSALYEIGLLFGKSSCDLWTKYRESR
jgi:ankyrin repeat protein